MNWKFLGESPWAWMVFVALVVVWLIVWGRIIHYLGGELEAV